FLQDRWTPGSGLTIDAGVRVDVSALPASLGVTNGLVTPRVGFAWAPSATWVVRGGAGIFADRIVLASVERPWLTRQRHVTEVVLDGSATAAAPSICTARPGSWDPQSRQVSAGAERQLTANLTTSINYLWVQGR